MRIAPALALAAALGVTAGGAQAQVTNNEIKIGILSDMSSLYTDLAGAGSVLAARMAVEDSGITGRGFKVDFVSADHQNKADVGSNIARQWYDRDGVDLIVDVPNSAVALAVNTVTREKNKVFLVSGAATSALRRHELDDEQVDGGRAQFGVEFLEGGEVAADHAEPRGAQLLLDRGAVFVARRDDGRERVGAAALDAGPDREGS